jgi:hypothetical protein
MFNYNNRVETTLNLNSPPLKPLLFMATQSRLPMLGTHDVSVSLLHTIYLLL